MIGASHRGTYLRFFGVLLLAASGTHCSVLALRPPPSAPAERTAKAAEHCGDMWYPIADTLSTIAGLTWVVHANQRQEEDDAAARGAVIMQRNTSPIDPAVERNAGYIVMGIFGASAIYGYYVEERCHALRRELEEARRGREPQALPPPRSDLPKDVAGFTFHAPQAQAQATCVAKTGSWQIQGSVARCTPAGARSAEPIRLEFESGTITRIAIVHSPPADQFDQAYDRLYAELRTKYGAPQTEPARPGDCATSLLACMKKGGKPKGPAWFFVAGSIALQPVWSEDNAALEERYVREETVPTE
jgi:hypothetical protein